MSSPSTFPQYFMERHASRLSIFTRKSSVALMRFPVSMRLLSGWSLPWRDAGSGPTLQFGGDGHVHAAAEEDPRAQFRVISPGFFARWAFPLLLGAISMSSMVKSNRARRHHQPNARAAHVPRSRPDQSARVLDRSGLENHPRNDSGRRNASLASPPILTMRMSFRSPPLTFYNTFEQGPLFRGRLFIHTSANPYSLVTPVTRIIRDLSADQPIERAATLEDARAEVLTPHRLNSVVFGVFAAVALAIAVVGVAGVLAFSVSARTREFGIRLALGSEPQRLFKDVIAEGAAMAAAGIVAGALFGFVLAQVARSYFADVTTPGVFAMAVSAFVLLTVAVIASMLPAARAARVDVIQALRTE